MANINTTSQDRANISRLTPREIQVLRLVAKGYTSKHIAKQLRLSKKTVDSHRSNIRNKFDFHQPGELVVFAVKNFNSEASHA